MKPGHMKIREGGLGERLGLKDWEWVRGLVSLSHRIYLYRVRRHQLLSERGVRWGQSSCGCEFPFGGRHQQPARFVHVSCVHDCDVYIVVCVCIYMRVMCVCVCKIVRERDYVM